MRLSSGLRGHATTVFQGDCIFQKETNMASKAGTISHTGPGKPATVEERTGLLHSTREQEIRIRAYEIYLQRGGQPGQELEDWLRAELEFTS
jgi:Protein of unknown function (DUF2934)